MRRLRAETAAASRFALLVLFAVFIQIRRRRCFFFSCCSGLSPPPVLHPAAGAVLVLRFDGSLRRCDGGGGSTHDHAGAYPPARRVAAGAACIVAVRQRRSGSSSSSSSSSSSNDDDDDNRSSNSSSTRIFRSLSTGNETFAVGDDDDALVFAGGTVFDGNVVRTSGHAEYEALLFGLEQLTTTLLNGTHSDPQRRMIERLVIQGDCKTVIHQLSGRSRARKLERYQQRASELLRTLRPCFVEIAFEHIHRSKNKLCDAMAAYIVRQQQLIALKLAWGELADLEGCMATRAAYTEDAKRTSKTSLLSNFWKRHQPVVPLSRRPAFYRRMATMASAGAGEAADLAWIGTSLQSDSEVMAKAMRPYRHNISRIGDESGNDIGGENGEISHADQMLAEAALYHMVGLKALKKDKQAEQIRRRKRQLLQRNEDFVRYLERTTLMGVDVSTVRTNKIDDDDPKNENCTETSIHLSPEYVFGGDLISGIVSPTRHHLTAWESEAYERWLQGEEPGRYGEY